MIQTQSFQKLKTIYKSPIGKVQIILCQDQQSDSENLNPNKQANHNNQLMVLKKYSRSRLGVNTLNEFTILKEIKHPNIISFSHVFEQKDSNSTEVCMTMDLMAPLQNMIEGLEADDIQYIFSLIVKGLFFVHSNKILHRDIKPSNILISELGQCKLSDFGIARKYESTMTGNTCTKNYRPPQLFLGQVNYGYEIDIWGLGCTLAEMFIKQILFDGLRETEILSKIADYIGDINETSLGDISNLKLYFEITAHSNQPQLIQILNSFKVPAEANEIIIKMLNLNPAKRPTIQEIIQSPYVINAPTESIKVQKLAQEWINKTKFQFLKKK